MAEQNVPGVGDEAGQAWKHLRGGLSTMRDHPRLLIWPTAVWLIAVVSRLVDFAALAGVAPKAKAVVTPLGWQELARLAITSTGRAVSPFPTLNGPGMVIEFLANKLPLPAVLGVLYFVMFRLAAVALFAWFLAAAASTLRRRSRRDRTTPGFWRLFVFAALAALWLNLYTMVGGVLFAASGNLIVMQLAPVWQGLTYLLFIPLMLTTSVLALSDQSIGWAVGRSLRLAGQGLLEMLMLLVAGVIIFSASTLWQRFLVLAPFGAGQLAVGVVVLGLLAFLGSWFALVWLHFTADRLRGAA